MRPDDVGGYTIVAGILAVLGFVGYAIVGSIRSNGETDYCYTEMWSPGQMAPQHQLYGHRPWRTDRMLGVYSTVEEARAKADVLGCPMGNRR